MVRAGISARREQAISRSLAEVIEADRARGQGDPLKVAALRLVGGGGSAELLVSGAMAARARHEYSLTERLARAAIEAGAGFEARLMAAETAHFQGRSGQAEQELAALAAQAASDAEKARVALLRFDNAYFERSPDFQIIDDTLAGISDPFWRDELVNRRLFVMAMSSRPREIAKAASTRIQRPDSASRVEVLHALVRMGRLDEAIEELTPPPDTRAVPAPDEPWHQWILFGFRPIALATPAVSSRRTNSSPWPIANSWIIRRPKRELSSPHGSPSFISSRAARRARSAGPSSPTPSCNSSGARGISNGRML